VEETVSGPLEGRPPPLTRRDTHGARHYQESSYRLFLGRETRQVQSHTGRPALQDGWHWEPATYTGDVLWDEAYDSREEAAQAAEAAYDAGEWQ
jgi:hypothetical protein